MADRRDILIRLLGEETVSKMADRASGGLDRFGDSLDATGRDAVDLDRQIAEVEGSLRELAVAFARTSDAADRVDLTKAIRRQQTELRNLTKSRDLLPDFAPAGFEAASGFSVSFSRGLGPALRAVMASGPGAVVGGIVAGFLVPTLSAGVAGAVVGGVGVGGVVGGVALAARDSRVQSAGKTLGDAVMGDLEESAGRFVRPTIRGIQIIQGAWHDVADEVDGVFAATSRYVEPLARGIGNMMREIMPGLRKAAEAAGPIIREIGEGLPRLGRALGDMFSDFADNAGEGASAIRYLFMVTESGIRVVGAVVNGFAAMYRTLLDVLDVATTVGETLGGWMPVVGGQWAEGREKVDELKAALKGSGEAGGAAGDDISDGLNKAGGAADTSAQKIQTWADVVEESTGRAIASERANIALEEAIDRAAEAAKTGADKGIDRNTGAGRRNRLALLGIAEAAKAAAADIQKTTGSTELASVATERGRKKFLEAAAAMGVEQKEATALANKLFGIPSVSRTVKVETKQYPIDLATVAGRIAAIKSKRVVISVHNKITTTRSEGRNVGIGDGVGGRAHGGPITGSGPKGVDSVLMRLAPGEHVLTAREVDAAGGHAGVARIRAALRSGRAALPAAWSGAGRGQVPAMAGGGTTYQINVSVAPTANVAEVGRQVVEAIRAYEGRNGRGWRS